jgi:WD40 repeat protein
LKCPFGNITCLAYSPDGNTLAIGIDHSIHLWEVRTGKLIRTIRGEKTFLNCLAFSPDGKTLAGGTMNGKSTLWEVGTGKQIRAFRCQRGFLCTVAFSPDGKTMATAGEDKCIRLWEVATGKEVRKLGGHDKAVSSVAFSLSGKKLASVGSDETCRLWALESGRQEHLLNERTVCISYSLDGRRLATISERDNKVSIWQLPDCRRVRRMGRGQEDMGCVSFSPDGRSVLCMTSQVIELREVSSGRLIREYSVPDNRFRNVTFSPDGTTFSSSNLGSTVYVWDVTGLGNARRKPQKLSDKTLKSMWSDLVSDDASKAHRVVWLMVASPTESVPFLKARLHRVVSDERRLARLIANLDDDRFQVRESATKELEKIGPAAEPRLRQALEGMPSAECKSRTDKVLKGIQTSPERVLMYRAMMVLEQIGTPEAREVLKSLAKGTKGVELTEEARSSLDRLSRRVSKP